MIIYDEITKVEKEPVKYICDKCKREVHPSAYGIETVHFEAEEFTHIKHQAGYGSVFEDGKTYTLDLCQYCLKELLGRYLRLENHQKGE